MTVAIRSIQHYMYCKRRFALLEFNRDWAENPFVVKANIMHSKVHNGEHSIKSDKLISLSNIQLYNDELDIFGIADCIEFIKSDKGVYIDILNGNYTVSVIEYKPTRPKNGEIRETDAIQVFAQKLCADSIWSCKSTGFIYYSDVRKRMKLPFDEKYDYYYEKLIDLLKGINDLYSMETIPDKPKGQKCSGCSLSDICMPLKHNKASLREEILKLMEVNS